MRDKVAAFRKALDAIIENAATHGVIIKIEEGRPLMKCEHTLSGCNYPESECAGICMQVRKAEDSFAGKTIQSLEREKNTEAVLMEFTDGSGARFEVDSFRTIRVINIRKK